MTRLTSWGSQALTTAPCRGYVPQVLATDLDPTGSQFELNRRGPRFYDFASAHGTIASPFALKAFRG